MFYYSVSVPLRTLLSHFRKFSTCKREKKREGSREKRGKWNSEGSSLFFPPSVKFSARLKFIGNFLPLLARSFYRCLIFSLAGRIFHPYAKKTHAENVCTRTWSTRLPRWRFLAPLYPSFSPLYVSPFASLFLDNSIPSSSSSPLSHPLSLARTHAGVVFLPSFSLFSRRYPSPPLFDADIPAKTICQNAGRGNCKASSTLFNLKI